MLFYNNLIRKGGCYLGYERAMVRMNDGIRKFYYKVWGGGGQ